jgi:hypothetical protein
MSTNYLPSTEEIAIAFSEEIGALGGTVLDSYDDGRRLYARAVLEAAGDVRPGDRLRAGIALRATGPVIAVHPYTYRLVCVNGAIMAHATQTRAIARVEHVSAVEFATAALDEVRLAVRECSAPEAFVTAVDEMRTAAETSADLVIHLLPMLARMPRQFGGNLLRMITERFEAGERSLYGLMNAVTSVARDTTDREVKWELEEFGGGMPALVSRAPRVRPPAAEPMPV